MVKQGPSLWYLASRYLPKEAPKKIVMPICEDRAIRTMNRLGGFFLFFCFVGMTNVFYNRTHATRTRKRAPVNG